MASSLTDAVAAYAAAAEALVVATAAHAVDTASLPELLDAYQQIEVGTRRVPTAQHAIINRLDRDATPTDLGATSLWKVLAYRCRIGKGEAYRRIRSARLLGPRRALAGEALAPVWEHTAAAQAQGLIGVEHVEVIRRFFAELPATVDPETRGECERTLARLATQFGPTELERTARHLLACINPDGTLTDEDRQRRRGLTLGRQQPDGMSRLAGWITPELRALLEPLLAKFTQRSAATGAPHHPGQTSRRDETDDPAQTDRVDEPPEPPAPSEPSEPPDPPDSAEPSQPPEPPEPPEPPPDVAPWPDPEGRSTAQCTHDAFVRMARTLLRANLGTLNGLPVTMVVTTTLQHLQQGAGYALTAGGSHLPIPDLIRLAAADADHYLAVFDKHTEQALFLGRAQRCASGAQKLMLFARDRGCTCPGCAAAGYDTQAHHAVADWKHDGLTNIDDLALACGPDNRMIETTGWTTRKTTDGRTEWIPPPHLDTGQARINYVHHPERLLTPDDDDVP